MADDLVLKIGCPLCMQQIAVIIRVIEGHDASIWACPDCQKAFTLPIDNVVLASIAVLNGQPIPGSASSAVVPAGVPRKPVPEPAV